MNIFDFSIGYLKQIKARLQKQENAATPALSFGSYGEGVVLERNTHFTNSDRIHLGSYIYIGMNTNLYGRGEIHISDYSIISSDVIMLSSMHNYQDAELLPYDQIELLSPINIGVACWVGIRSIILPGVTLEDGCIVGAGSVVTKSFPKCSIIGGNPAKVIKYRDIKDFDELISKDKFYMKEKLENKVEKVERIYSRKPVN